MRLRIDVLEGPRIATGLDPVALATEVDRVRHRPAVGFDPGALDPAIAQASAAQVHHDRAVVGRRHRQAAALPGGIQ